MRVRVRVRGQDGNEPSGVIYSTGVQLNEQPQVLQNSLETDSVSCLVAPPFSDCTMAPYHMMFGGATL